MSGKIQAVHNKSIFGEKGGGVAYGGIEGMCPEAVVDNGNAADFITGIGGAPFVKGAGYVAGG